ncbi:MAG: undecaprenyl-diphosphate phosphatase [Candidatus Dasytiphilus stammeri]
MLDKINEWLFFLINAHSNSPIWQIRLAIYLAQYLIAIVPLICIILWCWGEDLQRKLVCKSILAIIIALFLSFMIRHFFPHDRPFVVGKGHPFIKHSKSSSNPSNHASIIFTFALSFLLFWHRLGSAIILFIIGLIISWSRIYLSLHWPLDIIDAVLIAIMGCLGSQIIWKIYGIYLFKIIYIVYFFCLAYPINNGWINY